MAISKKMMNAQALEKSVHLIQCPICKKALHFAEQARLVCEENHSFDLSRQGYVNLAPQAHVTKYDKSLFEARKTIMASGFFDPLLERITALVKERLQNKQASAILDAGCGGGSHLANIVSKLPGDVSGIGIDLAKEGVLAAAKDYPGNSWLVADLANSPFRNKAFDAVLNILSPANYTEFTRLLKPDGVFIKVVPEENYLKELRAIFYDGNEQSKERNPMNAAAEHFCGVQTERVTYEFPLDQLLLENLIHMTPLSWGASSNKIESALASAIPFVTIDLTIITGVVNR